MSTNIVPLKTGGQIAGIVPQSIEEVFRLSQAVLLSGMAPKDLNTAEKITVAIMTGLEIGLPPMFALNKIAVINGRPTIWGDALPGLLWGKGFKIREWLDGETAHCEVVRPDGEKIERTFSLTDARKAGLAGKPGPWQQYQNRMLAMRARGFACRDGAADVLGGLYLREEIDESPQPIRDITPPDDVPVVQLEMIEPATSEQIAELEKLIVETRTAKAKFLTLLNLPSDICDLTAEQYKTAKAQLLVKQNDLLARQKAPKK